MSLSSAASFAFKSVLCVFRLRTGLIIGSGSGGSGMIIGSSYIFAPINGEPSVGKTYTFPELSLTTWYAMLNI